MRFIIVALLLVSQMSEAQQTVTFPSSDGLTVTADLYLKDKALPFVILFHQANYSRGEYLETAPRLMKLGFNCLAVDLRSGKEANYVQNQTAALALEKNLGTTYLDAEKDMLSAIEYVKEYNKQQVILFGSSYSASLSMIIAKDNASVKAAVAFSPGEYFQPKLSIKPGVAKFSKPLFIASTTSERPYVKEMLADVNDNLITWWKPAKGEGTHGSRVLWQNSVNSDDCWMSLLIFFKNIKKQYPELTF